MSLVFAQEAFAGEENPWQKKSKITHQKKAVLTITPSVCVIKVKGEVCQQILKVSYRSQQQYDVCIYYSRSEEPFWCEEDIKKADLEITVKANSSIKLLAKNNDDNNILATGRFILSMFQPAKERKRRHYGIGII
ncbi:DUF3019 domain-containing protein [Kangiella sediminilitoris]|nr:DUF3019 domain-containing protein [Kangiella sediminilitoris]